MQFFKTKDTAIVEFLLRPVYYLWNYNSFAGFMRIAHLKYFWLLVCLAATACHSPVQEIKAIDDHQKELREISEQIQDGDLVLRLGNDITSNMLAQLNLRDKRFSHIGICFVENGTKLVYHSVGSEYGTHNFLRKDSLQNFLDLSNNLSIGYCRTGLNTSHLKHIHDTLAQWYQQQLPFDMDFDWQSDDKMYCSELVAKAIMRGTGSVSIPITDTLGRQYFSIDNILGTFPAEHTGYYTRSLRKQ